MTSEERAEDVPLEPESVYVSTRIEEVLSRFQFHDVIKSTNFSRQYIVQDCHTDQQEVNQVMFFFLKQNIYDDESEFRYALDYYQRLQKYCKLQLAKNDIIKINQIYSAEVADENYFELVLLMDIGEPDRIDIENIQLDHITKFLKTVCNLLKDLHQFDHLYHGNICLKNIVLVQGELKLSGFKSVYSENPKYQNWKTQLCKEYGHFRTDLFMIGMLWLRFLGVRVENITQECHDLDSLKAFTKQVERVIPAENRITIITNLLDLDGQRMLSLNEVIMQFEEYFVMVEFENNQARAEQPPDNSIKQDTELHEIEERNVNIFDLDNKNYSVHEESVKRKMKSYDSQTENVFNQMMKDSDCDLFTLAHEGRVEGSVQRNQFVVKNDGEFTLQCDDSILLQSQEIKTHMPKMRKEELGESNHVVCSVKNLLAFPEKKDKGESQTISSLRNVKSANEFSVDQGLLTFDSMLKKEGRNSGYGDKQTQDHQVLEKVEEVGEEMPLNSEAIQTPMACDESINLPVKTVNNRQSLKSESKQFEKRKSEKQPIFQSEPVEDDEKMMAIKLKVAQEILEMSKKQAQVSLTHVKKLQEKYNQVNTKAAELSKNLKVISAKKIEEKKRQSKEGNLGLSEVKDKQKSEVKDKQKSEVLERQKSEVLERQKSKVKEKQKSKVQNNVQHSANKSNKSKNDKRDGVGSAFSQGGIEKGWQSETFTGNTGGQKRGDGNDSNGKRFESQIFKPVEYVFALNDKFEQNGVSFKKKLEKLDLSQSKPEGNDLEIKNNTLNCKKSGIPFQSSRVNQQSIHKADSLAIQTTDQTFISQVGLDFKSYKQSLSLKPLITFLQEVSEGLCNLDLSSIEDNVGFYASKSFEETLNSSQQRLDCEDAIAQQLTLNKPKEAVALFCSTETAMKANPTVFFRVLLQFYRFFASKNIVSAVTVLLIEMIDLLLQNNHLDQTDSAKQALALELTTIQNKEGFYERSIRVLRSEIFDGHLSQPDQFCEHLTSTYVLVGNNKMAEQLFEGLVADHVSKRLISNEASIAIELLSNVILRLCQRNQSEKIARFYSIIVKILQSVGKINNKLDLKIALYENLTEAFVVNCLRISQNEQTHNFTNFILHEIVTKEQVKIPNLNESEKQQLAKMIVNFCLFLKAKTDYGGFKNDYFLYLCFAKNILKSCDMNNENMKTTLKVNFDRGLFCLKNKEFQKAESILSKCVDNYCSFFSKENGFAFSFLMEIGDTLIMEKRTEKALFYFEKVIELNCSDVEIMKNALKKVIKLYFQRGEFVKVCSGCDKLFSLSRESLENIWFDYWHFRTIQLIANNKRSDNKSKKPIDELVNESRGMMGFKCFSPAFIALSKIQKDHHDLKNNRALIANLESMVVGKLESDVSVDTFIDFCIKLHFEIIKNKQFTKSKSLFFAFSDLIDSGMTVSENSDLISSYLFQICCGVLCLLPLFKESLLNHQFRIELWIKIEGYVSKEQVRIKVSEKIKKWMLKSFEEERKSLAKPTKVVETLGNKRPSLELLQLLLKSSKNGNSNQIVNDEGTLNQPIDDFFQKVIVLLEIEQFEDIPVYFNKLDSVLKGTQISTEKFKKLKQLISIHVCNFENKKSIDDDFKNCLTSIFQIQDLNLNDLKRTFDVVEGFKNKHCFDLLFDFLEKNHSNYFKIMATECILSEFNIKFNHLMMSLFNQITSHQFFDLQNHFFVLHFANSEIKNKFTFNIKELQKLRFKWLSEDKNQLLFANHVNQTELVSFSLRFAIVESLVSICDSQNLQHEIIARKFQSKIMSIVTKLKVEESQMTDLIHQLLLIAKTITFDKKNEVSQSLLSTIVFLKERFCAKIGCHFSRIFLELGKVFFFNRKFKDAIEALSLAEDSMSETQRDQSFGSGYLFGCSSDSFKLQVWSFTICAAIEMNMSRDVYEKVKKVENFQTDEDLLILDKLILMGFESQHYQDVMEAKSYLQKAKSKLQTIKIAERKTAFYKSILEKLSMMIANKKNKQQIQTENIQAK
jgi:tetratricopeptide (TPR) repeat protein